MVSLASYQLEVDCDLESWKPMGLEATASIDYVISDKLSRATAASNILLCNPRRPTRFRHNLRRFSIKSV